MKKYDKNQSFKCDEELDKFLKSLSKKSYYVNIEDVVHFESKDIIEQIKNNKEITIIV